MWSTSEALAHNKCSPVVRAVISAEAVKFTCSICLEVVQKPVATACSHIFCSTCIGPYLVKGASELASIGLCPMCRKTIAHGTMKPVDSEYSLALKSLKVKCLQNTSLGCPWQDENRFSERHAKECGYNLIQCACNQFILLKTKYDHQRVCKWFSECKFCQQSILTTSLPIHIEKQCFRRPVTCKQFFADGCNLTVKANEIDAHRQKCTTKLHNCPYQTHGCIFSGSKEALEKHTTQCLQQHLTLVLATCRFQRNLAIQDSFKTDRNNNLPSVTVRENFTIRLDDLVDLLDDSSKQWLSAVVRDIYSPSRIHFDILDTGKSCTKTLPEAQYDIYPCGQHPETIINRPIIIIITTNNSSLIKKDEKINPNVIGASFDKPIPGLCVLAPDPQSVPIQYSGGRLIDLCFHTSETASMWITGYFVGTKRTDCVGNVLFRALKPSTLEHLKSLANNACGFMVDQGRHGMLQVVWQKWENVRLAPAFTYVVPSNQLSLPSSVDNNNWFSKLFWCGMLVVYKNLVPAIIVGVKSSERAILLHIIGGLGEWADILVADAELLDNIRPIDSCNSSTILAPLHASCISDDPLEIDRALIVSSWTPALSLAARHITHYVKQLGKPVDKIEKGSGKELYGKGIDFVKDSIIMSGWCQLLKIHFLEDVKQEILAVSQLEKPKNIKPIFNQMNNLSLVLANSNSSSFIQSNSNHQVRTTIPSKPLTAMSASPMDNEDDAPTKSAEPTKKKRAPKTKEPEDEDGDEDAKGGADSDADAGDDDATEDGDDDDGGSKKKKKAKASKKAAAKKTPAKKRSSSKSSGKSSKSATKKSKSKSKKRKTPDSDDDDDENEDSDDGAKKKKRKRGAKKEKKGPKKRYVS